MRRDRNHACVWLWEPVLNETWYPEEFAKKTRDIVAQEYPYPYCYSGCDREARGHEHFPVLFTHPYFDGKMWHVEKADSTITYFTREWGDNVDDWGSHNSPSRVARNWGGSNLCLYRRCIMPIPIMSILLTTLCVVLPVSIWEAASGIRSTISVDIIPIRSMVG